MITITINQNSDEIIIKQDGWDKVSWKVKNPVQIGQIISELLNSIGLHQHITGIRIVEINEDHEYTKEEW